jgi:hypothetical protein
MDELAQRRKQRGTPPATEGSLDAILDDLSTVQDMVIEMRAEAFALEPRQIEVDVALVRLDDAVMSVRTVATRAKEGTT